jgi:hypothetical protein
MSGRKMLVGFGGAIAVLYAAAAWRLAQVSPAERAVDNAQRDPTNASSSPSGRKVYGVKSAEAKVMCEQFVRSRLKAPRTASFSHVWETEIRGSGDGPYEVAGFVDAQNSFGALLRNPYTCSVEATGGDKWKLLELDMR